MIPPRSIEVRLKVLLSRAEGLLSRHRGAASLDAGEAGQVRACLETLDRGLLAGLWKTELDGAGAVGDGARGTGKTGGGRAGRFMDWLFYRKGLLHRLKADGARVDRDLLRTVYGNAGSPRLILLVTHSCQLRCAYCRVRRYPARMTCEVAEAGVRWLMAGLRSEAEIQFFGGEPLLALDVVRRATLLAESLAERSGRRPRFLLTTNGLALSDKALRFFRDHRFSLEFSCDGTYGTQLSQRRAAGGRDYYGRLSRNLESLRAAEVPYQVIAVVTPENVSRMLEEFRFLAELGHRRIQLNYALGRFWDEASSAELFRQMGRVSGLAREMGVSFVNEEAARREPVVLNSELTVDCDGEVFRETGVCLEEDFREMKKRFLVTRVGGAARGRAGLFDRHGSTQFDNLALLAGAYGRGELRRTLLNNLAIGLRFLREPPWKKGVS
ncbi:MAG: radical SAM protein [Elusimicrobia bacterium]|nr:radical SAM protein [Elusimicrobiota bacterium]